MQRVKILIFGRGKRLTIRFPFMPLQAMFIENTFLLLASSWMFTMVSWDTVGIPAAVFCSFLIGETHSRCLYQQMHDAKRQHDQHSQHSSGVIAERFTAH